MTIYVDPLHKYRLTPDVLRDRYGDTWCHMGTDGSVEELHAFAKAIGLRRGWFQDVAKIPHYDLIPSKREEAIKQGAKEVSTIEFIERCRR